VDEEIKKGAPFQ
jgi:hypothetical protein